MKESARDAGSRGRNAQKPWQVPWRGWQDVLWRMYREIEDDRVFDMAAAVAFFGMLALFPTLLATVSLYSLLADADDVVRQVNALSSVLPPSARTVILGQLNEIGNESSTGLRLGVALSIAVALFSASGGVAALMRGVNNAYDETETRGWIRFRLLAFLFTVGFAVFVIVSVASITLLPTVLSFAGVEASVQGLLKGARWPALAAATMVGLGVLYRYAPNRTPAKWQWVTPGAVLATLIWTLSSVAFSVYAENYGSFNKTYGTLAGFVVLGFWMFLSSLAILLGAELNAELEHQTKLDSTIGPPRPLGERGACMADTVGDSRPDDDTSFRETLRETLVELNRGRRRKQ